MTEAYVDVVKERSSSGEFYEYIFEEFSDSTGIEIRKNDACVVERDPKVCFTQTVQDLDHVCVKIDLEAQWYGLRRPSGANLDKVFSEDQSVFGYAHIREALKVHDTYPDKDRFKRFKVFIQTLYKGTSLEDSKHYRDYKASLKHTEDTLSSLRALRARSKDPQSSEEGVVNLDALIRQYEQAIGACSDVVETYRKRSTSDTEFLAKMSSDRQFMNAVLCGWMSKGMVPLGRQTLEKSQSMMYVSIFLGVLSLFPLVVFVFSLRLAGEPTLRRFIQGHIDDYDLDGEGDYEFLLGEVRSSWHKGHSYKKVSSLLAKHCRKLQKAQRHERRKRLQEERERASLDSGRLDASLQRIRVSKRERRKRRRSLAAKLREEVEVLEKDSKARRKELETLLVEQILVEELESKKVSESDTEKRIRFVSKVLACTQELDLDGMNLKDLELLSKVIRRLKRTLLKPEWRAFVDRFDASHPSTYREILQLTKKRHVEKVRSALRSPMLESQVEEAFVFLESDRELLSGQSVMLVGGSPSLTPFYVDQLKSLGARKVRHFPEEQKTIGDASADLAIVFWRRVKHAPFYQARNACEQMVYQDAVGRKMFLRELVIELREAA